jgi:membrane dipeptidase
MPLRLLTRLLVLIALVGAARLSAVPVAGLAAPNQEEAGLVARARALHERVIALDTHVDIDPENFTAERSYGTRLDTQVNLPKMEEGGLDAAFFVVYVGQTTGPEAFGRQGYDAAYTQAVRKFEAIHHLVTTLAPDRIGLARTADDVRRIAASGRKVALIGVENGYPLGEDVGRVREFFERGARYISLAHNGHSQLSDSNTGERDGYRWNGLSPLGRQVIAAMNAHGIMIDVSHPSKASMLESIRLSAVPVIASHSSVRALCNHSRNLDDEQLEAIKANGGVAQMTAFAAYIRTPACAAGTPRADDPSPATVSDFVDHIDYAVKKIGIDHVGISSDFDGGGGVVGWNDASETFNVTLELVRRGYTDAQIDRLWSGNLLRVMEAAERGASTKQAGAASEPRAIRVPVPRVSPL